jgi:hypothetical protein
MHALASHRRALLGASKNVPLSISFSHVLTILDGIINGEQMFF